MGGIIIKGKRNVIATAMLSMALSMGLGGKEGSIKKHKEITRNWKDNQDKNDMLSRLEKAKLKRTRKDELRKLNLFKSREGKNAR